MEETKKCNVTIQLEDVMVEKEKCDEKNSEDFEDEEKMLQRKVEELKTQLDKMTEDKKNLKEKVVGYEDLLKRKQAEFENYKRRTNEEKEMFRQFANQNLIEELLVIIDSFKQALKSMEVLAEDKDIHNVMDGIYLIDKQMTNLLAKFNVTIIEAVGKKFDPNFHEAMQVKETNEHPSENIIEEWQTGYKMGNRIIRHSKVLVAKPIKEK